MRLLDTVALVEDVLHLNYIADRSALLLRNMKPNVFEVEFSDLEGRTYALETLEASQLMPLQYQRLGRKENRLTFPLTQKRY